MHDSDDRPFSFANAFAPKLKPVGSLFKRPSNENSMEDQTKQDAPKLNQFGLKPLFPQA